MNSKSLNTVDKTKVLRVVTGVVLAILLIISVQELRRSTLLDFIFLALKSICYGFAIYVLIAKWQIPKKVKYACSATIIATIISFIKFGMVIIWLGDILVERQALQYALSNPPLRYITIEVLVLMLGCAAPVLLGARLKTLGGTFTQKYAPPKGTVTPGTAPEPLIGEKLYAAFIKSNTEYYTKRFSQFAAVGGNFCFSFNIFAFFFPTTWLFYRKMYLAGVIMFLLGTFLNIIGWLLSAIIIGFAGNWLYFKHTTAKLALLGNAENSEQVATLVGGTNPVLAGVVLFLNVIVVIVLFAILAMIF